MFGVVGTALRIVVLLLSSATPDPAQEALESAARESLPADAELEVISSSNTSARQHAETSDALVEVRWSSDRQRATLNIYNRTEGIRSQREIEFESLDLEHDKGLHLGLLIGSLFDVATSSLDESRASEQAVDTPAPKEGKLPAVDSAPRTKTAPAPSKEQPTTALSSTSQFRSSAWLFDATLSAGLGGSGGGLGANFGWGTAIERPLWWQCLVGAQAGEVPQAQATTQMLRAATGIGARFPVGSQFELGMRVDALVHWLQVSHLSDDDPVADRQQRWNAGAAVILDAALRLGPSNSLVLGSGLELLTGETQLQAHGHWVATLARQRWISSVGFRLEY